MNLTTQQLNTLCQLAINAANEAGAYIATQTNKAIQVRIKDSSLVGDTNVSGGSTLASQIVTEVDIKSQELILKHLLPTLHFFDLGLLTEELVDDYSRFEKDYFWCIDPLDGTLSFTEGHSGYAVSIALVSKKGAAIIGVVMDPVHNNLYYAIQGQGVFKNYERLNVPISTDVFSLITDRSFTEQPNFEGIKHKLQQYSISIGCKHLEQIDKGGATMNAIWVIENNPACYFKLPKPNMGGGSLWDFAATSCIFNELGLLIFDFNGQPLNLNKKETTFMNMEGVIYAHDRNTIRLIQNLII